MPTIQHYRRRFCSRVLGDVPEDLEPEEWDPLGVLKSRVAKPLASQVERARTPPWARRPSFNIPCSPPSSRRTSITGNRSFHLGINKPKSRPARAFDKYASSKGADQRQLVDVHRDISIGPAGFNAYAASHGAGENLVPDHDTNIPGDNDERASLWDAIEKHERSLRVNSDPGLPRIAIFYDRAPALFDRAAALPDCPIGLRGLIAAEQQRAAAGITSKGRKAERGAAWIDERAPEAERWLERLPNWNPDPHKDRRLARSSAGRGTLTHVSGEIAYPTALADHPGARRNIRLGLGKWVNGTRNARDDASNDGTILPFAIYDHLPDALNDPRNVHCHFLFGTRCVAIDDNGGLAFAEHKADVVTRHGAIERLREKFAELTNIELERIGRTHERLHPGTYAEMGIDGATPNKKLFGQATVLERAGIPTTHGLPNDIENWSRRFDRARERRKIRLDEIAQMAASDAVEARLKRAVQLRYEAEELGLLAGMSVSRAKRTARFAPGYAVSAKQASAQQGWTDRAETAEDYLTKLNDELRAEREAIVVRRREAIQLEAQAARLMVLEREEKHANMHARAAAHRAVDAVVKTPLLITEKDGVFTVEQRDDPAGLTAGLDLGADQHQKRLAGQHRAQRQALAQVRAFIDKHGYDALFDPVRIASSSWMQTSIEQWRSSPILQREEQDRRQRAAVHHDSVVARRRRWKSGDEGDMDELVASGEIKVIDTEETVAEAYSGPLRAEEIGTSIFSEVPRSGPFVPRPLPRPKWPDYWRPSPRVKVPDDVVARWRADGKEKFAADILAFEHVLYAPPRHDVCTDGKLADALGPDAVWLTDNLVYNRLAALWLYQEATRVDLLAAREKPHVPDRERHAHDEKLTVMMEEFHGDPPPHMPGWPVGNRIIGVTLQAVRAGVPKEVCRVLADAAMGQSHWLELSNLLADEKVGAIWAASSLPSRGIYRRPRKTRSLERRLSIPQRPRTLR